jgi:anti-sigma B factor antagonist
MNNLNINGYRSGNVAVLNLHGNIRLGENNNEIHNTLRFLIEKGERQILLNFTDVTYIDSGGLGELVAGFTTLKVNGGELKIFGLTGRVREIMEITGLVALFEVFDDEQEAIESFQKTPRIAVTEAITGKLDRAMVS